MATSESAPITSPTSTPDPADRIIVATALEGHRLLTADDLILRWSGGLDRLDARGIAGAQTLKPPQMEAGAAVSTFSGHAGIRAA